ncbi:DUF6443 domain-containing protein [Paraflavitalea speifideaquila]|uniref:DUF6443 domain-containing protein n=1 Tax=Paraflavitalea speifideaquila TaxID=3076558 RepID=UPI0028F01988|nr:DUF6443 domain-containing protein [Paraflavitalea speifideiaquila]
MIYNSGFILFRIRGVQLRGDNNVLRYEGNWNYAAKELSAPTPGSGVVKFDWHEEHLNWQYSITFAEEGKRKEVISYFDGTLRSRQSVTLNTSDQVAVVLETIYDNLGRQKASVLPVPVADNTIHYFKSFNKNQAGVPYSFADIDEDSCVTNGASMKSTSGASQYYSPNNTFQHAYYYAKYIPDAEGYPLPS